MKWGWWRQFICPLARACKQLIQELCNNKEVVEKVVHVCVAEVEYCYRGLVNFDAYVVKPELLVDQELIC